MFLIDKINLFYFLLSLCFGLFLCYITSPIPDIIIKYPTPENSEKEIYKDNADNCFRFKSIEVKCPIQKKKILTIPIQNQELKEHFKLHEKHLNNK